MPVSIKDNITVAGLRCAWGCELYLDYVPEADETPVARLRAQGAVILGKTNVSEFTMGPGQCATRAFGVTRNPWNTALTPGASTGGGSIGRPASHCGLVGLKPSAGRVARQNGLPVILHDCEVIGPVARMVDDIALALAAIQGPLEEDRLSVGVPGPTEEPPPPKGLRILYVPRVGAWTVEGPIADSCAAAARAWAALGHQVEEGALPVELDLFDRHWPNIGAAGLAWLLRGREWRGRIGAVYEEMKERGQRLGAAD